MTQSEQTLLTQALEAEIRQSPDRLALEDCITALTELPGCGRATALYLLWKLGRLMNEVERKG